MKCDVPLAGESELLLSVTETNKPAVSGNYITHVVDQEL